MDIEKVNEILSRAVNSLLIEENELLDDELVEMKIGSKEKRAVEKLVGGASKNDDYDGGDAANFFDDLLKAVGMRASGNWMDNMDDYEGPYDDAEDALRNWPKVDKKKLEKAAFEFLKMVKE